MKQRLLALACLMAMGLSSLVAQTTHVITNIGLTFNPDAITIQQGDIIDWQIAGNHNVVEVSLATWNANGTMQLPGGFSTPFGGGQVPFNTPGTFYYVCQPHAGASMKGTITVTPTAVTPVGEVFIAKLTSAEEVVPTLSAGTGLITLELLNDSLFVSGSVANLSAPIDLNIAGGAHIHTGLAGENGGIVFPLTPILGAGGIEATFDDTLTLSQAEIDALRQRSYYVNIHTEAFAGGEVRGQIQPADGLLSADESLFSANLYGSNEVPSIMTDGSGKLVFDLVEDTLTVSGTFANLSSPVDENIAGGAHIPYRSGGRKWGYRLFPQPRTRPRGAEWPLPGR